MLSGEASGSLPPSPTAGRKAYPSGCQCESFVRLPVATPRHPPGLPSHWRSNSLGRFTRFFPSGPSSFGFCCLFAYAGFSSAACNATPPSTVCLWLAVDIVLWLQRLVRLRVLGQAIKSSRHRTLSSLATRRPSLTPYNVEKGEPCSERRSCHWLVCCACLTWTRSLGGLVCAWRPGLTPASGGIHGDPTFRACARANRTVYEQQTQTRSTFPASSSAHSPHGPIGCPTCRGWRRVACSTCLGLLGSSSVPLV